MRIAHLIDSLHWGGAEKWIASFAEVARLRGLDVTVISLQAFIANNPYRTQLESFGAKVEALSITRLYKPAAVPILTRVFRSGGFDVIQTHLSHANVLGTFAGRLAGIPVVATLHSTHLDTRGHYRMRSMAEQIALRYIACQIIAVGNGVAEAHRVRLGSKELNVVPNAVKSGLVLADSERRNLRADLAGDPNRTIIIAVGRMVLLKGYAELLTAFAEVRKDHSEAFLLIVGDGSLRGDLESQASALGIAGDMRFLGLRTDVPRLLAASDIFVNNSYWEGLSMSMLEAMAAGLPIIATNVGEAPFLLADGRGSLISPRDVSALITSLRNMLNDSSIRKGAGDAARSFAESHYALDPWFDKVLEVYSKAQLARPTLERVGFA